jgi:hypothetical protein
LFVITQPIQFLNRIRQNVHCGNDLITVQSGSHLMSYVDVLRKYHPNAATEFTSDIQTKNAFLVRTIEKILQQSGRLVCFNLAFNTT